MKPILGFIGLGKVGQTLVHALSIQFTINGVYNRTPFTREQMMAMPDVPFLPTAKQVCESADLIFLTVRDDAIKSVVAQLADLNLNWANKAIVHTSGASSLDVFQPLLIQGAMGGSLHPALPFADVASAAQQLSSTTFAIESNTNQLQVWLEVIVQGIGGNIIHIPDGQKSLYHAALCIASNYTVTLYSIAHRLLSSLGAEPIAVENALNTLIIATADNLKTQGIPDALTGPLSRADVNTLESHLHSLEKIASTEYLQDPQLHELEALYRALARQTYALLQVNAESLEKIKSVIQ